MDQRKSQVNPATSKTGNSQEQFDLKDRIEELEQMKKHLMALESEGERLTRELKSKLILFQHLYFLVDSSRVLFHCSTIKLI